MFGFWPKVHLHRYHISAAMYSEDAVTCDSWPECRKTFFISSFGLWWLKFTGRLSD